MASENIQYRSELDELPASQRNMLDLFHDASVPKLTALVRGADGEVYTLATDMHEARGISARWNAEEDPRERAHSSAYPFSAEARS